ncbi:MAG: ABC transporter ATP-binding protein [Candidatus Wallbacteria bacterium]|nr:ABC transporter ATP-binding protein [Candidatus Wallbacteria bacterium]
MESTAPASPPDGAPALSMRGVSKRFGELAALADVGLEVKSGEIHALLGENGAGKTTLMNVLYGLVKPDAGRIEIDGRPVALDGPRAARAAGIGMVHQHLALVEPFTVAENLVLDRGPARGGLYRRAVEEAWARELAAGFGLALEPDRRVAELSLGERQRVEIVKALTSGARILVLDEPTTVLTPPEVRDLFVALRELAARGRAVVFISHKLSEVLDICGRITVLRQGVVQGTVAAAATDEQDLARRMVGHSLGGLSRGPRFPVGQARLLEVVELGVDSAAPRPAMNFHVSEGEIVGIAGVEGNGQLEICETLSGMRPARSGTVRLGGRDLTRASPLERARAGLGVIPEDRTQSGVVLEMSVADNLALRAHRRPAFRRGPFRLQSVFDANARELVAKFEVRPPDPDRAIGTLSGGNQQKLLLARELSERPTALVAANPTRGLDVAATEALQNRLLQARAAGMAILLVSTDLDEVLALSDRILVAFRGQLAEVPAEQLDRETVGLMMGGVGFPAAAREEAIRL